VINLANRILEKDDEQLYGDRGALFKLCGNRITQIHQEQINFFLASRPDLTFRRPAFLFLLNVRMQEMPA
jgi:hypothetical protein